MDAASRMGIGSEPKGERQVSGATTGNAVITHGYVAVMALTMARSAWWLDTSDLLPRPRVAVLDQVRPAGEFKKHVPIASEMQRWEIRTERLSDEHITCMRRARRTYGS